MKLGEWMGWKSFKTINTLIEDLHVIGTCGECKWWGSINLAEEFDNPGGNYRECRNKDIGIFSPMQRCGNEFSIDFGCIHFEEKGK